MSPFTETTGLDADDPILELAVKFSKETRQNKVNLAIGSYQTDDGYSWVLPSVIEAEKTILAAHLDKDYLPIEGDANFLRNVNKLLFGKKLAQEMASRLVTMQSIGGTSALRLAADYLRLAKQRHVYVSNPTWPNHPSLCKQAGLLVGNYPYFNPLTKQLDFQALLDSLKKMPKGSAVLLHVCCHNPTGVDLTFKEWQQLLDSLQSYELFPFFDMAYQGFSEGLEEDAAPLRYCVEREIECLVANSFSKNFGLYGERVGSLTAVCKTPELANRVLKQFKTLIRRTFSNPPLYGERIVHTILSSNSLHAQWEGELKTMRTRITAMRALFLQELQKKQGDKLHFLKTQKGLFSYGWLSACEVKRLKDDFAIYLPNNGRIAIPGLTHKNLSYVVHALNQVTGL